ncbi:MAG: PspA-associated protein PspAA [Candidatus Syntropharchaeia archaeon]
MIVRIMNENQYVVDDSLMEQLNVIDNRIVELVESGDESFREELKKLISMVRERGKPLDPEEIKPSDIIVPPEDITLEEARRIFTGEGLIPD